MPEDMGERGAMLKATRIYLEQTKNRRMSQASKCKAAPEFIVKPNPISVIAPGGGQTELTEIQEAEDLQAED
ncbi:glk [Symbiodinium sp. KB8]|nr:glk [Symbiodinium sp. KB8]